MEVKQSNCKTKEENDDEIAITDTLDELDAAIDQMQKEEQDMDVDSGNQASNENSENENPDALSLPSHMAPSNNIDQNQQSSSRMDVSEDDDLTGQENIAPSPSSTTTEE